MKIRSAHCDRSQRKHGISIILLLTLLMMAMIISSCNGPASTSENVQGTTEPGQISATVSTPSATASATIEPTVTVTPFISISEGQALPDELEVISAKNIRELQEIGRWGNGVAYDLAWSPDGRLIAVSTSRYLLLINGESFELIRRIDTGFPLYCIAFSFDGSKIYGGGTQGKLMTYDIETDNQDTINLGNILPVTAVAVSHNGQYVAVADWHKSVHLWDLENNRLINNFAATFYGSKALGFSNDDEVVFGWSPIEPILGWHILTAQPPETYYFGLDANQRTGSSVRFSADGNTAAVNQTWQIRVQNLNDGTTIGVLKDFNYEVEDLAISADGGWTLSLHSDEVRLWQNNKSKLIAGYSLSDLTNQNPVAVRFSPDASRFVLLGQDLVIFEIDIETNEIAQTDILSLGLVTDLSFTAQLRSDDVLYQMGLDGVLYELPIRSGEEVQNNFSMVNQISAYTVSESMLAVGFDNYTIEIRDLENMAVEKTLRGLSKIPAALLVSESQNVLVAQTDKNTTGIWELSTGNYLSKQEWGIALDDLQLSFDQRYLLGSGDGRTQRYDLEEDSLSEVLNGRLLDVNQSGMLLQRYSRDAGLVLMDPVSFNTIAQWDSFPADGGVSSPDGKLLALSGKDLIILDTEDQEIVLQMENPARGAALFFSSDGRLLIFVYADGSKLLYGVPN